jgi:hypothetical protein
LVSPQGRHNESLVLYEVVSPFKELYRVTIYELSEALRAVIIPQIVSMTTRHHELQVVTVKSKP